VPVRRLPHLAAGDCEDGDPDQDADQERQVSVIEPALAKEDNARDLAADCDDPREDGKYAKTFGGSFLTVRSSPFLGHVNFRSRLVLWHVQIPCMSTGEI
jgi:hypothetical protein